MFCLVFILGSSWTPMFVELIPEAVVAVVVSLCVYLVAGCLLFVVECVDVAFDVSLEVLVSLGVSSEVFM